MLVALGAELLLPNPQMVSAVLGAAIAGASIPLLLSLFQHVLKGNFSVDILALLSIGTSIILGQYWVAAIVVLMLSGGQVLKAYAARRASSVLSALAKRMPLSARRAGELDSNVPIDEVAIGDQLLIYPHEICPVDGLVVAGQGSMDESYLTGEPFLIAKAPGATVLSGAIIGWRGPERGYPATAVTAPGRYAARPAYAAAPLEKRGRPARAGLGAHGPKPALRFAAAAPALIPGGGPPFRISQPFAPILPTGQRGATPAYGNAALTIQATKKASDSRYAKIVEGLHASEENRPQIRRLGDRLGTGTSPVVGVEPTQNAE
ncbi:MAG TPA: hypothetical protein VN690_05325 [Terriglobales bacterium]|nr:hypothetical protein [Terriglobales bacterium]